MTLGISLVERHTVGFKRLAQRDVTFLPRMKLECGERQELEEMVRK